MNSNVVVDISRPRTRDRSACSVHLHDPFAAFQPQAKQEVKILIAGFLKIDYEGNSIEKIRG